MKISRKPPLLSVTFIGKMFRRQHPQDPVSRCKKQHLISVHFRYLAIREEVLQLLGSAFDGYGVTQAPCSQFRFDPRFKDSAAEGTVQLPDNWKDQLKAFENQETISILRKTKKFKKSEGADKP